jgi:autotransporter-associated beta strand protein
VDNTNSAFNVSGGTANLYGVLVDSRAPIVPPVGSSLNLSGGEISIGLGGLGTAGNSQVNLSGGKLSASAPSVWSTGIHLANNTPILDTRSNNVTLTGGLYGKGGFTKTGNGFLVLTSTASNLAGSVNLNAGVVYLTGSWISPNVVVNVNSGAALVLDGTGSNSGFIAGTVNVSNGGSLVGVGNAFFSGKAVNIVVGTGAEVVPGFTTGILGADNFSMSGGNVRFDLNATDANPGSLNDLVSVQNALNFTGGTVMPSFSGAPTSGNVYTLFTAGTLTGLPTVSAVSANSRLTYLVGSSGSNVTLTVNGTVKSLTWTGATNNTWNVNGTQNWSAGGGEKFFQADSVTFAGAAPGTITLTGSIQPILTTVDAAVDYTFSTGGSIDTGALVKSGTGSLTLLGAHSYTGGTTLNNGVLAFSNGSLGGLGVITMNGGTLKWQGTNTQDISNRMILVGDATKTFDTNGNLVVFSSSISGANDGGLVKTGAGTLAMGANNGYTGTTTISGGILQVGIGGSAGSIGTGPVVINSGAKLTHFRSGLSIPVNNNISGPGTWELKGDGSTHNGDYIPGGNNSGFSGNVIVTQARLQLDNPNDIGTATVTVNSGGQLYVPVGTYANPLSMAGIGWAEFAAPGNLGALRFAGSLGIPSVWSGPITLTGDARIHTHSAGEGGVISGSIAGTGFGFTKTGAGQVILGGSSSNTYTGLTILSGNGQLGLAKTGGAIAIPGDINMSSTALRSILWATENNQFGPGAVMRFTIGSIDTRFELKGTTQTLAGIDSTGFASTFAAIQHSEFGAPAAAGAMSTLILNGSGNYFFKDAMRNQGGIVQLIKNGTGTQTFSLGGITYTGPTVINQGTLRLFNMNTTPTTATFVSPTTIAAGGTLDIANTSFEFSQRRNIAAGLYGPGTVNISGGGRTGFTGIVNLTGVINITGNSILHSDNLTANWTNNTATLNIAAGSEFHSRGQASSFGTLVGAGAVGNDNGSNGGTAVFTIGKDNGTGTFSGVIHGNGTSSADGDLDAFFLALTKVGPGTQTLTGSNTYSGVTTVNGGTLLLDFAVNRTVMNNESPLNLGGGTLAIKGAGAGITSQAMNTLTLNGGGISVSNAGANTTFTLAGLTRNPGGTLSANLTGGAGTNTLNFTNTATFPAAGSVIGWATVTDATGTNFGTLSGNSLVRFTGPTTVLSTTNSTVATTTTDFTTAPTDPGYVGGVLTLTNAETHGTNSLKITSGAGGTLDLGAQTMSFTSGGLLMTGTGSYTIQNGQLGASDVEVNIHNTGSGTLTINAPVSGGAGILSKGGSGTLILTGTNTYTGVTNIFGTLQVGAGGTSGTLGTGAVNNSGILAFNRSDAITVPNLISGGGGVTKFGPEAVILTANDTYAGGTTITAGTLQAGADGAAGMVGPGPVFINTGAKLALFRSGTGIAYNSNTSGAGTIELKGNGGAANNGDYIFGGNNSAFTGVVTVTNARLQLDHAADLGSASVVVDPGGQLLITAGNFNSPLTVSGVGWLETTAPNTLGAIRFGGAGAANWSGPVTLAGNTVVYAHLAADIGTISGNIGGNGNITKFGPGFVNIAATGANTYAGTVIVDNGTLQLGNIGGPAVTGAVQMGNFNGNQPNLRMMKDQQFAPGVVMTFVNVIGAYPRFDLQGTTQTLSGIQGLTGGGVIQNERLASGGTGGPGTLIINNTADYVFDGFLRDEDDGGSVFPLHVVKNGPGIQVLSRSLVNSQSHVNYTGTTTVNNGTLKLQDLNAASGAAFNSSLVINSGGTLEVSSSIPFATRWNYGRPISGNGTINKTGTGVFGVTNVVNFAGTINVLEGTFMNDGNVSVWTGSTANVNVSAGAIFDCRADPTTINSLNGAGTVTNSYGNGFGVYDILTIGVANGGGTLTGPMTDGGTGSGDGRGGLALTKVGTGTQILAGTNTYSGVTTINAGTLRIGNGGNTGTFGTGPVVNNSSLVVDRTGTLIASNTISGPGTLTKVGTGTLNLTGHSTYTGTTIISEGTIQLGVAGSTTLPVPSAIWLDATDGATISTTAGGVVTWANKGSLGVTGDVTAVAGFEPHITAAEPAMNNQQVIHFDAAPGGVAPYDRMTNALNFTTGDVTIIYVGRLSGSSNERLLSATGNNWLMGTWGVSAQGGSERAYFGDVTGWVYEGLGYDTNARIYSGTISSAATGGNSAFYVNSVLRGTKTGSQGPNGLSLGGGYSGNPPTENSSGDFGELLLYNGVLSNDDRLAVEAYLTKKWFGAGGADFLPATSPISFTAAGTTLDLNGVTQTVGSISGVAGSSILLNGGNLTAGADNASSSYDGTVSGAGTLHKAGSGNWTLNGTNTIGGDVTIDFGALIVNGTLSGATVTVNPTGALGGSGTVNAPVTVQLLGVIAPGPAGPGAAQLDVGNFNLTAGSLFKAEIGGAAAGTQYDQLNVTGTVTLGGDLNLSTISGFSPLPGQPFWLALNDGADALSGVFGNVPVTNISNNSGTYSSGAINWTIYYSANFATNSATGGNDILATVVPEPASAISLLCGVGLLLGVRRRRA